MQSRWNSGTRISTGVAVLLAGTLTLTLPAWSQTREEDQVALGSCLSSAGDRPANAPAGTIGHSMEAIRAQEGCIGTVFQPCQGSGVPSKAVQKACLSREMALWVDDLAKAYEFALRPQRATPKARANLVRTQRAWITWRDAACGQPKLSLSEDEAGPAAARCLLEATARQAIWMNGWD